MIRYYKLFDLLNRRGMNRTDLLEIISSPTLAKLSKGQNINTDIIDKICIFLGCQPSDIMEVIYDVEPLYQTESIKSVEHFYKKDILDPNEIENSTELTFFSAQHDSNAQLIDHKEK